MIFKVQQWLMLLSGLLVLSAGQASADESLLGHWLFDGEQVKANVVTDAAGGNHARVVGQVRIEAAGELQAIELDGTSHGVEVAPNYAKLDAIPRKQITAEVWTRIDRAQTWGGLVGILQDNGAYEKGWLLGFMGDKFSFALNGAEGDAALTYLAADEPFARRQWHHVVGTYDGREHRLYVDGKLAKSSQAQSGDIDYPPHAFYEIGGYRDDDEFYRTAGAIHEVCVFDRALSAEEIARRYEAKIDKLPKPSPLRLPAIFASNMVLQRDGELPVWGWSDPGGEVVVKLNGDQASAKADEEGRWRLKLPPQKAGGPHTLEVTAGEHKTVFHNVLIGEVWICSGQSNMQWGVNASANAAEEIKAANHPNIRLCTIPNVLKDQPQDDCDAGWHVCSPETVAPFSAVAYYFGRKLNEELDVPIGLINSSWGGSVCEAWMSREKLESREEYKPILERAAGNLWDGTGMYNAMIHPVIPYRIRGAIWYQGESNSPRGYQYRTLFPDMIADWRERWGQGDFPFYYVQLCPFARHDHEWPELWEAQLMTLSVANTGMAVTTDIAEVHNIHPPNKQDVGLRLARWALAKDYGRDELVYSGPLYKSMRVDGDAVRLRFDHAEGLKSRDGQPLSWFTIAGEDQVFRPAVAVIEEGEVVVRGEGVKSPQAVRFGWLSTATPNLVNEAGLPASPFRTDDWPAVTAGRH